MVWYGILWQALFWLPPFRRLFLFRFSSLKDSITDYTNNDTATTTLPLLLLLSLGPYNLGLPTIFPPPSPCLYLLFMSPWTATVFAVAYC